MFDATFDSEAFRGLISRRELFERCAAGIAGSALASLLLENESRAQAA